VSRDPKSLLRELFDAAVAAADPARLLPGNLPSAPAGRTIVLGAGKAAARMARALETELDWPITGFVVTRYGHSEPCHRVSVLEAAHPLPDAAGGEAGKRMLDLLRDLTPDDLVICLLSGGGSALLELPPHGLSLAAIREVNSVLLKSGATIAEINCVRKHLSLVKGGRLAEAAHPARVITYIISDVPGDDPSTVASGPTVPDPTTCVDALEILRRYAIEKPVSVIEHLKCGAAETPSCVRDGVAGYETPKPGDRAFSRDHVIVLATARDAINAAARRALELGVAPVVLGHDLEGEARELGQLHARLALECRRGQGVTRPPCVLLSGGETTVTVCGSGRGGRNVEYLLGLGLELGAAAGVSALAADTDGIDGTEDNAGAFLSADSLLRAERMGLDPASYLAANDAYGFFSSLDDLLVTGPTKTNVNDFRAVLVAAPDSED
jgi:glycerate 2-kinase